jgi:hypothetical protein
VRGFVNGKEDKKVSGSSSSRPSRWEAHRNALMLSLAFSSLLFGFAFVPVSDAYTYSSSHSYKANLNDIYTDWDNPTWIKQSITAYSNGQNFDAVEYSTSSGGTTAFFLVSLSGSGVTVRSSTERIVWSTWDCQQVLWLFPIRSQSPTLNTQVDYVGGGGFTFSDYFYAG